MEEIILPQEVSLESKSGNEATIVIEPFYPGYGVTCGNALRRVLLSSLPGAAATAIKIKGVEHEFSTIDNVKEDVMQIILNIKKLRVKLDTEKKVRLSLKAKGKKKIKASEIKTPSGCKIVNPDLVICEGTNKEAEIDMEIIVEKGRGYSPCEARKDEELEIGMIAIDAIFTPVLSCGFQVENIRVGKRTDFDKLKLFCKTDGTITPQEAFCQAAKILSEHFSFLADAKKINELISESKAGKKGKRVVLKKEQKLEEKSIFELNFSTRTLNALNKAKVRQVKHLMKMSDEKLMALPGFGKAALDEVKAALKKIGVEKK